MSTCYKIGAHMMLEFDRHYDAHVTVLSKNRYINTTLYHDEQLDLMKVMAKNLMQISEKQTKYIERSIKEIEIDLERLKTSFTQEYAKKEITELENMLQHDRKLITLYQALHAQLNKVIEIIEQIRR